jgi:hypothetical protein
VNMAPGPPDGRPPAGRRVMSSGVAITLIAVGAMLRFALAGGSPHGLNVHVVGVVLILVGILSLLLSLLVRAGPRRPRSLVRQGRGGYYGLPGQNARLQRMRQAAAADVAEVLGTSGSSPRTRRDARKTIFKPGPGASSHAKPRRRVRLAYCSGPRQPRPRDIRGNSGRDRSFICINGLAPAKHRG